ncbi:hypothetical protein ACFQJ7_00025 [Halovenus rubra]|uniref:Uncharacterized protein n=2 Tax=Halovenus rubra TaxID=869890 RepID=A0ACC7E1N5_9EURY|nr:hypothetical protein [Halovenus rubra]
MQDQLTGRRFAAATTTVGAIGLAGCPGGDGDSILEATFRFDVGDTDLTVTHDRGDSPTGDTTDAVEILHTMLNCSNKLDFDE